MRTIGPIVSWILVVGLLTFAGCGGGGSAKGDFGVGGPFRVISVEAFPNGPLLPVVPQPPTQNQYLVIEFSRSVDPNSIFDPSTPNGVASGLRLLNHYYVGNVSTQNPPTPSTPQASTRLEGFLVWNGQTNFDPKTKTFRPANQLRPVTPEELGIPSSNWRVQPNILYFVADTDGDPGTRESFLPSALKNTSGLKASQIQVDCQTTIRSRRGEFLTSRFGAAFNVGDRDWILPRVDSVEPVKDQTGVSVNAKIRVRFTEPIEASTVSLAPPSGPTSQTNFLVEALVVGSQGPQPVQQNGTITPASGQTFEIVFTPQASLPGNTVIRVTITSGSGNYVDRGNNGLAQSSLTDGNYTFTTGAGPVVTNNPVPPQVVHFITQNAELGAIETNEFDGNQNEDFYYPINEKGDVRFRLSGALKDIQIGPFIAPYFGVPGAAANVIGNPPVQNQYLAINLIAGNPPQTTLTPPPPIGKFTPPGVQPDNGLCNVLVQPFPPPVQPLGNFLFVSNDEKDVVHVINSNTYQLYKDIPTPDPRGLAVDTLLGFLFVSNFGAGTVSVLDILPDPATNLPRGRLVREIRTGNGPDAIVAQPDGEDVIVVNRLENTASFIQLNRINSNNPVRVKLSTGIGPACLDVAATGRIPALPPFFQNFPWYAYFANQGNNTVSIFEAGPQQINGYGRDNIIQVMQNIPQPTALNTDERSAATAQSHDPIPAGTSLTGCFVVCGDGTVRYIRATRFKTTFIVPAPPAYIGVDFEVSATIRVGDRPRDVVARDPFVVCQTNNNKGAPDLPATGAARAATRLYVANSDGSVSVVDLAIGKEIFRLPAIGVRKMAAYYTQ